MEGQEAHCPSRPSEWDSSATAIHFSVDASKYVQNHCNSDHEDFQLFPMTTEYDSFPFLNA